MIKVCPPPQKHALMERVAHQVIVMQYILELAKQLERDPRSCVAGFFLRCTSIKFHREGRMTYAYEPAC